MCGDLLFALVFGFFIPVGVLLKFVLTGQAGANLAAVAGVVTGSVSVAILAALLVMVISTLIVLAATYRGGEMRRMAMLASTSYAVPGTMLAIGVLIFAGAIDRIYAGLVGDSRASLLLGGLGILLVAYLVRFQAVGYGAVLSGIRQLPDNMMGASRVLGNGFAGSLQRVILPLLRGSIMAGGLLVLSMC